MPGCEGAKVVQGIFDTLSSAGSTLPLLPEALRAFDPPIVLGPAYRHHHQPADVLVDLYMMYYKLWQLQITGQANEFNCELMTRIEIVITEWADAKTTDV